MASSVAPLRSLDAPVEDPPSDRLRWIADYLDLADKAIASVEGLDCPADLHRGAQQDLRRWAHCLDTSPALANGFAVARLDTRAEEVVGSCRADGLG
jgi:hypothetical protein